MLILASLSPRQRQRQRHCLGATRRGSNEEEEEERAKKTSLERKNEKKNDEFWISWTFFQKSKMKKKPKKEPAKKVWCLVMKDKKRGETHYPLCGFKKMKTRRESLKEEEEH